MSRFIVFATFILGVILGSSVAANEPAELRGLWVTRFEWASPDPAQCKQNIIKIFEDMQKARFNVAVFQIRGSAEALYPSPYEPWSHLLDYKDPGFDPLQLAIEEAHKRNIQLHAYINTSPLLLWREGKTPPADHLFHKHGPNSKEPWVCYDESGNLMDPQKASYYYLSMGIPDVHVYLRKIIMNVVRRYNVDGVHFDRVRYPGKEYSYDKISRQRFISGNPQLLEWKDWQRNQLDKLINDIYAEIYAEKPNIVVSCAAWGIYSRHHVDGYDGFSSGYHDYFQDSWNWVRIGAMDVLMPMIYWDMKDPKPNYHELLQDFIQGVGETRVAGGQRMYGEGWEVEENLRQIEVTRQQKALGHVVFSYGSAKEKGAFSKLLNCYTDKVKVPEITKANHGYGVVLGKVLDLQGNPITDAWIYLKGQNNSFSKVWTSSADGRFAFLKIPEGNYELEATFADQKVSSVITVTHDKVTTANISVDNSSSVFVSLLSPRDKFATEEDKTHVLGRALPGTHISVNGQTAEVFATGAFAVDNLPLQMGVNEITVNAVYKGKSTQRKLQILRKAPAVSSENNNEVKFLEPTSEMILFPDDILRVQVKGPTGRHARISWKGRYFAMAESEGVYTAAIHITNDMADGTMKKMVVQLSSTQYPTLQKYSPDITIVDPAQVMVAETTSEMANITYGIHEVRLGGPFAAEVPQGTKMQVVGKQGDLYKVKLAHSLFGWISAGDIKTLPLGTLPPKTFFTYCIASGTEAYDLVSIPISEPIVYSISSQVGAQNTITLDLFDTHHATTWFTHKNSARYIGAMQGEQVQSGWYRLSIPIKSKQIWGYWVERQVNQLLVFVKRPPKIQENPFQDLTFAIEAGHGGSNTGAVGPMGTKEKDVNQLAALELEQQLQELGAKTISLRIGDRYPSLQERRQQAENSKADILISIHANAASLQRGYLRVSGTSTYYKNMNSKGLAECIHQEMLALQWNDFGLVGNFNYFPIRTTQMPAVLVEQAFLSHIGDEAKLLNPEYRKQQTQAIIRGIKAFLLQVREQDGR